MSFSNISLCKHHHNWDIKHSNHPKKFLCATQQLVYPPWSSVTTDRLFFTLVLPVLDCHIEITQYAFFSVWLLSLHIFEILPVVIMYQKDIMSIHNMVKSFKLQSIIPLYEYIMIHLSIHLLMDIWPITSF